MIPRLYLDEDTIPGLARLLRESGYDVVSAHESGALRLTDEEQLAIATSQQRAIVSSNHHDFRRIAIHCDENGIEHWGIVLVYGQYRRETLGDAVRAVSRFLDGNDAQSLRNTTHAPNQRDLDS